MIKFILQGRLANQMFQYACAYASAKALGTKFTMQENETTEYLLPQYFTLDDKIDITNSFFYKLKQRLYPDNSNYTLIEHSNFESFNDFSKKIRNHAAYKGFFQSELYFKKYGKDIQEIFILKPVYKNQFEKKYGQVFKENKVIALHIRRTDYLTHPNAYSKTPDVTLPFQYYEKLLKKLAGSNCKVIFVSDDIKAVKEYFGQDNKYIYSEDTTTIIDFQIIQNADVAVISNSTFSWWAAYLNNRSGKTVFAPKYWLGFKDRKEYPQNIMACDFNWINVIGQTNIER